jgi:glycosyltransferase involved in cell wall biosynthesis
VAAGHEARVVGAYPDSYPGGARETDCGVRVERLRVPPGPASGLRARLAVYRVVSEWARSGQVDLIELPDWEGWAAGWPALPVPVVVRLSGSSSYFAAELGKRASAKTYWVERASLRRADRWCSESLYVARRTQDVFRLRKGPDAVIYNPVPVEEPAVMPARDPRRVVFGGTLTVKKGILSLASAWPLVRKRRPDAELLIYGKDGTRDGGASMRAELEARFAALPSGAGVRFLGHVALDELLGAFHSARAAILPSYAEGFSLTPLHAMATGCPTIYSSRGSGGEVIEDGQTGLLVDPDRPEEIATAIVRVLDDDALAERLGRAGRESVLSRFSLDAVLGDNLRFYRAAVEAFGRRPGAA